MPNYLMWVGSSSVLTCYLLCMYLVYGHFGAPKSAILHHSVHKNPVWETRNGERLETEVDVCAKCRLARIMTPDHLFELPNPPEALVHCSMCDICVLKLDHHCGVFDKCITRSNIFCFHGTVGLFFINCEGLFMLTVGYMSID